MPRRAKTAPSRGPAARKKTPKKTTENTQQRRSLHLLTACFFFAYVAAETAPPLLGPAQATLSRVSGLAPAELSAVFR
jgi:hypothetical protein